MEGPLSRWRRLRAEPRRRDVVDATATAVVGLLLIALGLVDVIGPFWPVPGWAAHPWWHAAPLLLGCLALVAKRRHPVTTMLLVLPLLLVDMALGGSIGMYVVLIDALYCLALHISGPRLRPAIIAVATPIVLGPIVTFLATGDAWLASIVLVQCFALLGAPVWWGLSVRQQAQLTELAEALTEDLHQLSELQREQAVRSASVRALQDLRQMILLLQTGQDPITPAAGLGDVDTLVRAARGTGLHVDVEIAIDGDLDTGDPRLPLVVDHAAYRIVQESLANATKHAPASHVAVGVHGTGGELHVAVTCRPPQQVAVSGGRPDPVLVGSGLGVQTMRDRATALGGSLRAGWREDADGAGRSWVVEALLPMEEVLAR